MARLEPATDLAVAASDSLIDRKERIGEAGAQSCGRSGEGRHGLVSAVRLVSYRSEFASGDLRMHAYRQFSSYLHQL